MAAKEEGSGELLVAWQKYKAIGPEELTLNEGDVVELIDTEDPTVSTPKRRKLDPDLEVETGSLLDSSAAKHKLSVKPKRSRHSSRYSPSRTPLNARWLVRRVKGDGRQGWVPCQVLQTLDEPQPGTGLPGDAAFRRQAVVKELVETEQEFVRDLDFVVQKYLIGSEREPRKPKIIKDNFELLFGNLKEISEFHRTVLMEGVKYYANEPHLLGRAFLRLERDFDKHVNYCKEEPLAQNFLDTCMVARDYFEELSHRLGDDKTISEHLKLPIQRINDYQLLLKELVRYSACLGEDNTDLQKALELMLSVPHRAQDDKFTNSIEGYRGSIHKLGRLLAHDWFSVCFGDITKERYLFLFKARVLISKVRRISDDRSVFQLKDIIKLPQVDVRDHPDDPLVFELLDRVAGNALTLTAHRENVKDFWLKEIREFAAEAAEELTDDLQVVSQLDSPPESPPQSQYRLPKAQAVEKLAEFAEKKVERTTVQIEEKRTAKVEERKSVKLEETQTIKVEGRQTVKVEERQGVKVEEKQAVKVEGKQTVKVEERHAVKVEESQALKVEERQAVKLEEKQAGTVEEKKAKVEEKKAKAEENKPEVEEKKVQTQLEEKKVAVEAKVDEKKTKVEENKIEAKVKEQKLTVDEKNAKVDEKKVETKVEEKKVEAKVEEKKVEAKAEAKKVGTKVEEKKVEAKVEEKKVVKVEEKKVVTEAKVEEKKEAQKLEASKIPVAKSTAKVEATKLQTNLPSKVETNPNKVEANPSSKSEGNPKVEANLSSKSEANPKVEANPSSKLEATPKVEINPSTNPNTKPEVTKVEATAKKAAKAEDKFPQPTPKKQKLSNPKLSDSHVSISSSSQSAASHVINRELHEYGDSFRVEVDVNLEVESDGRCHVTDYGTKEEEMSSRRSLSTSSTTRYSAQDSSTNGRSRSIDAGRYAETTGRYGETTGRYGESTAITTGRYAETTASYRSSSLYDDSDSYSVRRRSDDHKMLKDEDRSDYGFSRRSIKEARSISRDDDYGARRRDLLRMSIDEEDTSILSKIRDENKYKTLTDDKYSSKLSMDDETSYLSKIRRSDDYDDRCYKRLSSNESSYSKYKDSDYEDRSYKRLYSKDEDSSEDYRSLSSAKISSSVDAKEIRYRSSIDGEGKLLEDIKERSYRRLSSKDEENGLRDSERSYRRLSSKEEGNGYKRLSDTNEERSYKRLSSKDEDGSYRKNEERSYTRLSSKDEDSGYRRLSDKNGERSYSRLSSTEESGRRKISIELSSGEDKSSSLIEGEENRLAKFEKYSKRNEKKVQSDEGKIEEIKIKRQESKIQRQESRTKDNTNVIQIEESKIKDEDCDTSNSENLISNEESNIQIEDSNIQIEESKVSKPTTEEINKCQGEEKARKIHKTESIEETINKNEEIEIKTKKREENKVQNEESKITNEAKQKSKAHKEESSAYKEESYSTSKKSKVKIEERGSDSFQGVTQKTIFDHQVLEEVVKRSKSGHDIGMAPPDETPKFTKTVGGAHIKPGEGTVFEIKLEETPDSLTWLRDNRIIDGDLARRVKVTSLNDHKTWRLEIFDAKDEDSGGFTAVAVNAKGKSTCTAHLLVHKLTEEEQLELKKPDFIIKLKDTDLLEDTYLRFMLKVKGDPAPTLTFFKDGKKIQDSDRIKVNRDHSDHDFYELVIPDVKPKDAGFYKCTAINEFGEASCEATVSVSSTKALFEDLPEHQKDTLLPKGEKPSFLWKKDGQEFEAEERFKVLMGDDEDSLALIFQHVKPEDAGLYTCVAQTSTGHISCSAELTVQGTVHELYREPEKPQLIIEKREAITSVAASCMMELQVKGFPKPKVTWTHEGKVVEPSGKYKFLYEDEESMSLVIKNIEPADAGKYEITAENELGQDIREMQLIVKMPPSIVKMADTTASTEQELKMTAVIDGIPKPEVTFYKDGKVVKASEHIKIVEEGKNHSILIKDTVLGDSGSYSVVASNEMAQVSQFWNLDVYCKPKILKKLGYDTSVYQKEEFEMSVQFESDPPPEVTWYKDDVEIKSDSHYVISKDGDTYKLKISGTVTTDSAQYKCRAKNIHGTVDDEMRVDVKRSPTITSELKDITATEHDKNVTLDVKVDSFPRPAVRWFLDEVEITESRNEFTRTEDKDGASLIIKEASTTIAGKYTCRFSNELGECSSSCSLTVNCKPKIIKHLKDTTVEESASLHLEVEVECIPEPSVKWLRNGREVSSDARIKITRNKERYENYHLTVDLIKYEEQGEYEVQITNAHGTISSKSQVTVHKVIHTDAIEEFGEVVKVDLQEKKYGDEEASKVQVGEKEEAQKSKLDLSEGETIEIASVDLEAPKKADTEDIKVKKKKPRLGTSETIEIEEFEAPKTPSAEDVSKDKHKKAKLMETVEIEECDAEGSIIIEDVSEEPQKSYEKLQKKTETFESSTFDVQEIEGPRGSLEVKEEMRFQSVEIEELQFEVSTPEEAQSIIQKLQVEGGGFEAQKMQKSESLQGEEAQTPRLFEKMGIESKTFEKQESQTREASSAEALPQITSHSMKDTIQFASLATSFSVTSTGNPAPTAIWSLNGNPIKPDSNLRFKISEKDGVHKMEIVNLDPKDAGVYECSVTNCVGDVKQQAKLDITPEAELRRPKIRKDEHGLQDQTIVKKKSVTLQATIVGDPVPDITWLFNGKEITPAEFEEHKMVLETNDKDIEDGLKECVFTLTIPRCERVNGGKYTLKVKNKWGDVETSGVLTVVLTPEIIGPDYIKVVPGDSCELTCVIQSNPPPIVTWTKSENVIEPSANMKIIEDVEHEKYILKFEKTLLSDEGYYKVYAKNEYGESSSEGRIKVITDKPSFITGLGDAQVEDGGEVSLMVRADGLPLPDIQWLINGKAITDAPELQFHQTSERQATSTLTITNFGSKDEGIYQVNAVNVVGDVETHAKVSMLQTPPTFIKKLERSEEVNEAEPLVLRAKVGGSPKPKVLWYKDGEKISPDNERIKLEHLPDGTVKLTIDSVTPIDSGAYKLVIKNKNGENAALCAVAVNATPRRPKFIKLINDTKVMLGEPLKLVAKVTAHPPPEVKWFKDGLPMRATSNVHLEHHPDGTIALVVDCVRPENAGKYSVVISNKLGEITGEAKVEIEKRPTRPEFVTKLIPQTVIEGFPVKFEAKAVGFPAPSITWTRNGAEVISDSKHIKVQDLPDGVSVLMIEACDEVRDAITYVATARNEAGEAVTSAALKVNPANRSDQPEERPTFLHDLRDVITDEGQALVLEAPFTGNPIPSVEWLKDGQPIAASGRILLTCDGRKVGLKIDKALPSDAGVYTVAIINPLGSESTSAKASVHKVFQPAKFTQRFNDLQQLPTRDAKFPARVSGVPQPEVTWSKDGQPITKDTDKYRIKRDGDACCLYVMDCQEADNGTYTAIAANKEGQDTCSAKLEVVKEIKVAKKIEPANFVKRIGDTDLYKGMTAKFTACAAGTPEPTVEWYRNDQRLYPSDRIRMECDTNGLLRLTIAGVDQDDLGKYTCKIHNEHGADSCDAQLRFDEGLESKKRPIQDQYEDYNKYKKSGAPMPLADAPIISRMTDRHCTLSWKPSIPSGPRAPVTYQLEMLELPGGDWFTARSGIRSCVCSVGNLEPFRDYKFRVRVENMYGISDPSPYAVTHREKLEPEPPKFMPYLPPGIDFRPETSPYFPKDFDIDRPPHDNVAQAPRFLRQEHDAQYGVKDQNTNLFWFVYGYPKPKMTYYFNDELIESGGRFDMSYTRNGQATLFINKMLDRDVGWYEAVATNEHGEARQRVRLEIAELPTFIRRPDIEYVMVRGKARFEARIAGVPYPEIKWYKDWKPLANSSRTKIQFMEPDTAILIINDSIFKDEGLYSVSARNVAGSISASAMLHVEENDLEYNIRTYNNPSPIKMRKKPYSDAYDIGDELGRGTSGITYHAAERLNGRNYAAKIMHGRGDFRPMMYNEWEMMNQLCHRRLISLHDAYEHEDQLTLIMELAAGGELVKDYLLKQEYYTESDIAGYIRQLLQGLQYMHERGIGHMGLNIGDLLLSHPGSDELKISDFGLTRRIQMGRLYPLKYGVPEYVSPECANGEGTGLGHDMWSVGIITYILLSGHSPFRGVHDMETLTRIQGGKWQFEESYWSKLSLECRDFITKLLIYQAEGRMDVHTALRHPWLERADKIRTDEWRIETRYLRDYFMLYREWYDNASCRKWFRRRPLEGAFTHPSKMVYPPGERYTPPPSEPIAKTARKPTKWEDQIPSRSPLNYEIGAFKSESHYQNGPDTYLLQLRDVDFPVRLREYMKVAGSRGAGYAHIVSNENGYDWETPVIRERRRFTDIMDEEIDDERKTRISRYGSGDAGFMVRRLRHEIGTRLDTYAEAEAFLESKMEGRLPFFREKPQGAAMREGFDLELVCLAVGEPDPVVQWFKNDAIIAESHRMKIEVDECGRSHLRLQPALSFDAGMYKVVARNKLGQTIARCRVVFGTVPDAPDSPEATQVSDTEALLQWKQPKHDGNSPIICYSVQYKLADDMEWSDRADNVDHEFYLMKDLIAGKNYIFRLAAKNLMGWSDFGVASPVIMTQPTGSPKVQISKAMLHLQQITDSGCEVVVDTGNVLDYTIESQPVEWTQGDPQEKYNFISEIARGRFSTVVKALDRSTDTVVVAKLIDAKAQGEDHLEGEFAALRSLRNERIATLIEAFKAPDGTSVFVLEKLQGADVLTYLASRHEYSEQIVATIVAQVLDGLQYLHWRGLCHLDLQPDNIVMCGVRSVQCKLVDLGCAHRVTKLGNKVPIVGHPDYIAPEVLHEEPAHPQTDIWSLGVLTYILLSGTLPFKGADDNESRQNILFVRYRFEHLYKEVSQEGVRFVMLLFKRQPVKRPTAEECHENRWLLPTDHMIKKRERAIFLGNRLKEYSESYHSERSQHQTQMGAKVTRSLSVQEELDTAPF